MNVREYEAIQPHINLDGILFLTPNQHCEWRVNSLYTKEPDTIAWIKAMNKGETLFDIGANMGQYSLLAAQRGLKVHAFEPESQNFALLCRNVGLNRMNDRITPWNLAVAHFTGFDRLHCQGLMTGGSCHSYSESVDFHLKPKQYSFDMGCASIALDQFVEQFGYADHIKLDVDGLEHQVILGGIGRAIPHAKSVLIEINTHLPEHMRVFAMMKESGFSPDTETADQARRKSGPFEGVGNVIFYRN